MKRAGDTMMNFREARERKKAKEFFDSFHKVSNKKGAKDKVHLLMAGRLRGFFDLTFIQGAKQIETSESQDITETAAPVAPTFRQVSTLSGRVWVYLDQETAQEVFELGRKYQLTLISKDIAVEAVALVAQKVEERLGLQVSINPLDFLDDAEQQP